MSAFDDIMETLHEVPPTQLIKVIKAAERLMHTEDQQTKQIQSDEAGFYQLIQQLIRDSTGVRDRLSYQRYCTQFTKKSIKNAKHDLDTFLEQVTCVGGKRVHQVAAYRFLVGLLVAHQQKYEGLLTVPVLLGKCNRIAAIFDSNFPGYLRSGLGHVVFQQVFGARGTNS